LFFLGLPQRGALGRAVSQLAIRSALRRLCRLGLALWATAVHPSADSARRALRGRAPQESGRRAPALPKLLGPVGLCGNEQLASAANMFFE